MSFVNVLTRELFLKVVYCGPGMCGKTANVQHIYRRTLWGSRPSPPEVKGYSRR